MKRVVKYLITVLFIILFAAFIMKGISVQDHQEVEINGNILCLSCIGIE